MLYCRNYRNTRQYQLPPEHERMAQKRSLIASNSTYGATGSLDNDFLNSATPNQLSLVKVEPQRKNTTFRSIFDDVAQVDPLLDV